MEANKYYIPKEAKDAFDQMNFVNRNYATNVNREYADKFYVPIMIVNYRGNTPRKSFQGFGLYLADFGSVGDKFADLYIRKCYLYKGIGAPVEGVNRYGIETGQLTALSIKGLDACLEAFNRKEGN